MPKVIFNGDEGEAWTNETPRVLYQFFASLENTCGACLSYHHAISSFFPIPLHRGCLLPGTRVVAPGVKAGLVARYHGNACRITLADGTTFAITANHMLLTPHGFARADSLTAGDDVINCLGREGKLAGDPDDDWKPAPIEQVIHSFSMSGSVESARVPVSPEDLHGDGRFCDGEINIVSANSQLRHGDDVSGEEGFRKLDLGGAGLGLKSLSRLRGLDSVLFALRDATDGGVGSVREAKSLRLARLRHAKVHGVASPSWLDSELDEDVANRAAAYAELVCHSLLAGAGHVKANDLGVVDRIRSMPQTLGLLNVSVDSSLLETLGNHDRGDAVRLRNVFGRFPGQVSLSRIRDVVAFHYDGPVYDVETTSTLYAIENGIASSNCRCRQELVKPGATAEPWVDFRKVLDGMSPDQRREAVGASNYRLLKQGAVEWDDVVTNARVRSFREVVARQKLTVPTLTKLGVPERIATAAWDSTHTTGHQAAAAHRKALVDQLGAAGLSPQQIRDTFARGAAAKVTLAAPHYTPKPITPAPVSIEPLIQLLGLDMAKVRAAMKAKAEAEAEKKRKADEEGESE